MDINKLSSVIPQSVITQIPLIMEKFKINTPLRLAHFLSQCLHESGGFKSVTENLNYSESGLLLTFPKYFNSSLAKSYAGNPNKIANRVYGGRMGNGPESSGDGSKYKGRGYIQLTGKANYQSFSNDVGEDCVSNPDLVSTKYPLASAAWFFSKNGINQISDQGSSLETITKVTKRVNGGTKGLSDRVKYFNKVFSILQNISRQPGAAAIIKTLLEENPESSVPISGTGSNISNNESGRGDSDGNGNRQSSSNNITGPGIVNIFKPTISPNEITFNFSNVEQATSEMISGLGYIPFVWYNAYQIDATNIKHFSLYYGEIAPVMNLTFTDTHGFMKDKAFPMDDTKITLFMHSRSEQLKPIYLQFKISTFSNSNGILTISSILDIDNLYVKKFKSYSNITSNGALQDVCKEIGLGFNTNINDTNDRMTWINTGKKPYDFISEILDHSYISDESFIYGYIDNYYNFNFVDIQKELSRDISKELGVVSNSLSQVLSTSKQDDVARLLLTNDASVIGSNIYFDSYRIINNSTSTSIENGYSDVIKYYDMLDKSILNFKLESLNNNTDKSIILKGAPQDDKFYKSNKNFVYGGRLDKDNQHKNFSYTKVQNNRNIIDSEKIGLEVELSSPNYNIYKYQKIKIILSSNTPTVNSDMINQRLSGDWLIVDIKFMFSNKSLKQVVTLIKRELELSQDEIESELVQSGASRDTGRGTYANPSPTQSLPSPTSSRPVDNDMYKFVAQKVATSNGFYTNYPNLPVIASQATYISVKEAVSYIKSLTIDESVKKSIFAIMWAEAKREQLQGGSFFKGINHNYSGTQTDSGKWPNPQYWNGQTPKVDSGNANRMFACFDSFVKFAQFMSERVAAKGFGTIKNGTDFANIYITKWWSNTINEKNVKDKSDIYDSAMKRYV